jgi:hypothetical protein
MRFPVGSHQLLHVMPGLVPGIHALLDQKKAWMAGTSPAMTAFDSLRLEKALVPPR